MPTTEDQDQAPAAAAPPQSGDGAAPPRRRPGRPSKLTPKSVETLLEGIKNGLSYRLACIRAGIDYSTLRRWVEKGEQQGTGEYREFQERLAQSEADGAFALVLRIKAAAPKDWRAAAFLLEARHPDEYGRRRIEVTGKDGDPIKQETTVEAVVEHTGEVTHTHSYEPIDLGKLTDDQLDQLEQLIARARTDGDASDPGRPAGGEEPAP